MAVGDVVSGWSSSALSFQPSSGVEVMIVSVFAYQSGYPAFYLGLNNSQNQWSSTYSIENIKIAINNTNYFYISGGSTKGYTGIQIK